MWWYFAIIVLVSGPSRQLQGLHLKVNQKGNRHRHKQQRGRQELIAEKTGFVFKLSSVPNPIELLFCNDCDIDSIFLVGLGFEKLS